MESWRTLLSQAIYQEYDRRIRRASLVVEYGAGHHAAEHAPVPHQDEDDAEIANVPRGAAVASHPNAPADAVQSREALELPALPVAEAPASPAPGADSPGDAEIVNAPPGTPVK